MMENYSLSDIKAATDSNNGFGNGNGLWLILLFALAFPMLMPMMMQMFGGNFGNQHGFGGAATAAAQNEILLGQNFDRVEQKLDSIAKGICDSAYAVTNAVTNEGRAIQGQLAECCCQTQLLGKDIMAHGDSNAAGIMAAMTAGFQRVIDNQNGIEMQHLRDGQMRDYIDKSLCGVVRYPLSMTYASNCNPFCPQPNPCGYSCGNGF